MREREKVKVSKMTEREDGRREIVRIVRNEA